MVFNCCWASRSVGAMRADGQPFSQASKAQAALTVSEVVSGGEAAIQEAVATVGQKISLVSKAFEANIRNQAFANLNITTLSDYLDQTIWQSVFNVLAFLLAFVLIYAVVMLVINLLDHVIRFPVFRMFDWLLGGLCGVARSLVVAVLLLCIIPPVVSLFAPEMMQELLATSTLYSFVSQMDFLNVAGLMTRLVG